MVGQNSLERPELIKQVHAEYFAAGADCAITASYQSTIEGFAARGIPEADAIRLIQTSVELAAHARDEFWAHEENRLHRPKPLVAASIGPYGASLADGSEYRGHYGLTEDELISFHRPRMKALIESGADLLACETIPCLSEAKAITRLLEEFPALMHGSASAPKTDGISAKARLFPNARPCLTPAAKSQRSASTAHRLNIFRR